MDPEPRETDLSADNADTTRDGVAAHINDEQAGAVAGGSNDGEDAQSALQSSYDTLVDWASQFMEAIAGVYDDFTSK